MTDDERHWCLDGDLPFWAGMADMGTGGYHQRPFLAAQVPRLGIPGFAFSDGPRGVVVGNATCFPVTMARGATWDVDLEERIGDAIGRELRASRRRPLRRRVRERAPPPGVGPGPGDLRRGPAPPRRARRRPHPRACSATSWPRVKHFACNSMENARFTVDVTVDEVALHEVYLPHFKRIVDEGVACVMSAYNAVNGEWCGQSPALLTDDPPRRVGLRGLRHQRLDLRAARRRARRSPPGSTSRCRPA